MANNVRLNPATGQLDYFFPMEITDSSIREYAKLYSLEIGKARLGYRTFEAVFVPCKDKATINGAEVFIDTPSDIQRQRYLEYIKEELAAQDAAKQDGRCNIPDGHGGLKRCPCRVSNKAYTPGGSQPKTLPVRCEGCVYEQFRQAHTTVELSCLDHEDDSGEMQSYEIPSPRSYYAANRYEKLTEGFLAFVKARNPKILSQAELQVEEFTKSEVARMLGVATSTVGSRTDKLKELLKEFLDSIICF